MVRSLLIVSLAALLALTVAGSDARGQAPAAMPADLAGLPDEIKSLKWQTTDVAALSPLEHCRVLLLLNHSLDELSSDATAQADLMSTYIQQQNLGAAFAQTPPPPAPPQLTFAQAEQVAAALLSGPMSKSFYATELGDVAPAGLTSYAQMYLRTCQRRWSEVDESRHQVRCMKSFLGNSQKLPDFEAWATAESARRQEAYKKKAAETQQQAPPPAAAMKQVEEQNQMLRQALSAAEYQHRPPAPQQAAAAQPPAGQAAQQEPAQATVYDGYDPYYVGYGAYYGAAAAGAAWAHDETYDSAARAATEQRMSSFHGDPAAAARRGGYRR